MICLIIKRMGSMRTAHFALECFPIYRQGEDGYNQGEDADDYTNDLGSAKPFLC